MMMHSIANPPSIKTTKIVNRSRAGSRRWVVECTTATTINQSTEKATENSQTNSKETQLEEEGSKTTRKQ